MLLVIDQPRILLSFVNPVSYFSAIILSLYITKTERVLLLISPFLSKALATAAFNLV